MVQKRKTNTGPCATQGCGSSAITRGKCSACYSWERHKLHKIHELGPSYMTQYQWGVTRIYTRTNEFLNQRLQARARKSG